MSDVASLYAVLLALYLAECLHWVPGSIRALTLRRGRVQVASRWEFLRGALSVVQPVPPFGPVLRIDLDQVEPASNRQQLSSQLAELRRCLRPLGLATAAQWLFLLIVAPAVVISRGWLPSWRWLAVGALALHLAILVATWWSHRTIDRSATRARWQLLARLAIAPPAAMRAVAAITWQPGQTQPAWAIAQAVGDRGWALQWGREQLIDQPQAEPVLAAWGLSRAELSAAPARESDAAVAYCPRCLTQFTRAIEHCSHCQRASLVRFTSAAES
jgi:hypothetical protein